MKEKIQHHRKKQTLEGWTLLCAHLSRWCQINLISVTNIVSGLADIQDDVYVMPWSYGTFDRLSYDILVSQLRKCSPDETIVK